MPERLEDELLLSKAGQGDSAAFLELYQRYRNPIFRFSYRLLGNVELAEDVTHDCFVDLIRKPENFHSNRGSLSTYLYGAARNLALKHFRKTGREAALEDLQEHPRMPQRQLPLRQLLDRELSSKVQMAVSELPELQREALILFEYEGLSLSEVARVVDADVGAVKARIHRARQRLKNALLPYLDNGMEVSNLEKALK